MIHLIGVDHLIQYKNDIVPENLFTEFKNYLKKTALKNNIKLFAEEFSEEALYEVYNSSEAIVKFVADSLGIEHRFCDPSEGDRGRLGIPYFADIRDIVKRKYNIREKYITDYDLKKKIDQETLDISKSYWGRREEFWFDKIKDKIDLNIIFICGHEHTERFDLLLRDKGYNSHILDAFWYIEIFNDYKKLIL